MGRWVMSRVSASRRRFLQSATGGMAAILAAGKAPAFAQAEKKKLVFAHIVAPPESSAVAFVEMAEAIFNDRKKILPCAAYLEGEYGIRGLFVGVPVVLGAKGIEKVIELKLTADELAALSKSAGAVQELVGKLTV